MILYEFRMKFTVYIYEFRMKWIVYELRMKFTEYEFRKKYSLNSLVWIGIEGNIQMNT